MKARTIFKPVVMLICFALLGVSVLAAAPPQEFIMANAQAPTSGEWDPQYNFGSVDIIVASMVFDRLVDYDFNMKLVPRLATSWKWPNPKTLHMTLRKNVKFHDGTPFTAADVKATLERVSNPKNNIPQGMWWSPVTVKIINDYTIDIVCEPAFAPLLNVLAVTDILSAKDIANPAKLKAKPNGTGYYKFIEYKGGKVSLEANEDYWDGPPKMKRVSIVHIEDPSARLIALQTSQVYQIERCDNTQIAALANDKRFKLLRIPSYDTFWLGFNFTNKYLANQKVRKAFAHAIDREAIVKHIMGGYARVPDSILPKGLPGYKPQTQYKFDPGKAKKLLAEAGYANGFSIDFAYGEIWPKTKEIVLAIAQYLTDIGIKVNVLPMETGAYRTQYAKYDMFVNSWAAMTGDADMAFSLYMPPLGPVIFNWQDAKAIELFQKQREIVGSGRNAAINDLNAYLWDQLPIIPINNFEWVFAINAKVKAYNHNQTLGEYVKNVSISE